MTVEQKAKRYDEALERARIWKDKSGMPKDRQGILDDIFPELKESEDEQSRKWILEYLYDGLRRSDEQFKGQFKCAIAWLEKQELKEIEQKSYGQRKECLDCQFNYAGECKGSCQMKRDEQKSANSYCQENCRGFQETGKCFADGDCEAKREAESVDKVEPKFHEGDWIVQGYNILKIKCVGNTHYCFETVGGYVDDMLISEIDSQFHLWTIQDAKDGDVLAFYCEYKGNKMVQVGIIEKYVGKHGGCSNTFKIYVGVDWENNLKIGKYMGCPDIQPATKEQRDTLFAKMHEAEYDWDAEKKKLKKIDWNKHIKYEPNCPSIIEENTELSEDERIRKELIAFLKENHETGRADKTWSLSGIERWIDWLESLHKKNK